MVAENSISRHADRVSVPFLLTNVLVTTLIPTAGRSVTLQHVKRQPPQTPVHQRILQQERGWGGRLVRPRRCVLDYLEDVSSRKSIRENIAAELEIAREEGL